MSEDRPDDDDGTPSSAGGTAGEAGPDKDALKAPTEPDDHALKALTGPDKLSGNRTRRLWIAGLALAVVATLAIVTVIAQSRRGAVGEAPIVTGDGGAALRSPKPPALPGDPSSVRLSGFVVDGTNSPVVGAEVTAELERGAIDQALATVPAGSAAATSDAGAVDPVNVAAPTGTDGRFVLEALAPGRYRIRVTGPGLLPAEVRYVPVPSDEARIVVARRVSIEGTVVDGGTAIANATVGLRGEAIGGGIETRTDARGAFRFADLPEGRYQLHAWRDTLAARAVRVNRLGAGPFTPVELALEAASIVVGRVIDREEGIGLIAAIELRPSGDDQAPRYARTAADGTFRIEGVPNGRWIADAFAPGYTSPGGVEVDAGRGIPELALTRGATLEGRVLDGEGRPIANASVRALGAVSAREARGTSAPEYSAAVDQDRLRRFSGRIAAPAPMVSAGSSADPQLLARGELGVMVGPIPPIPPPGAQVARPASIDVSAAGPVGEPPPLEIDPARASIWTTDSSGRYRIRGVPRGKHAVLAVATGFAEGQSKQVTVELGQTVGNVDVILTAGTMVFGKVSDQHGVRVAGAQVHAEPELGAPLDAFTDDEGMYRIGPVTGTVELAVSAYGHGGAKRTLELSAAPGNAAAERREDLVLSVADAVLAGTLDDATGAPVATAQLEIVGGVADGRRAVVNDDGTFSIDLLPAGPLRVRVTHPSYPTVELDAAAASHDRARVRLRLPLGGAIAGVLLDNINGAPLGGLIISAYGPGGATADTTTETDGRWTLGPLRPGRWKLTIEQPGYLPVSRELDVPVSRTPGATSVHDVRFDLARGALVGGTVRDARGQRVIGATVVVQAASGDGPSATGATDSQGEFRIRDAPTGELAIVVTSGDARGTARVTIRPGDEVLGLAIELR